MFTAIFHSTSLLEVLSFKAVHLLFYFKSGIVMIIWNALYSSEDSDDGISSDKKLFDLEYAADNVLVSWKFSSTVLMIYYPCCGMSSVSVKCKVLLHWLDT